MRNCFTNSSREAALKVTGPSAASSVESAVMLRRLPWHWRRPPSAALAQTDLRHQVDQRVRTCRIINTLKHAQEVSGVEKIYALVGGFHLAPAKTISRVLKRC